MRERSQAARLCLWLCAPNRGCVRAALRKGHQDSSDKRVGYDFIPLKNYCFLPLRNDTVTPMAV